MPPGPVSVSSRTAPRGPAPRRSSRTAAPSRSRPTKLLRATGRGGRGGAPPGLPAPRRVARAGVRRRRAPGGQGAGGRLQGRDQLGRGLVALPRGLGQAAPRAPAAPPGGRAPSGAGGPTRAGAARPARWGPGRGRAPPAGRTGSPPGRRGPPGRRPPRWPTPGGRRPASPAGPRGRSGRAAPATRAIPKSSTLTWPSASITFWGLRSRCTTPWAWASSRARAISSTMARAGPGARRPSRRQRACRVSPATYSSTRKGGSPAASRSTTRTTRGEVSTAAAWASRRRRSRYTGSRAKAGCRALTATGPPVCRSVAR